MAETRYIISDAAKMINVEPHVLRYWEEELAIEIPRNELGHRYYTEKEIHLFENIRDLKEKGFQLKAIKLIITTLNADAPFEKGVETEESIAEEELAVRRPENDKEEQSERDTADDEGEKHQIQVKSSGTSVTDGGVSAEDKMKHFKYIMDAIVTEALQNNNAYLENMMALQVTDIIMQELEKMEEKREQQSEKYYKMLDESIRGKQHAVQEVAAARVPSYGVPKSPRQKRRLFGHRYKY